MLSYMWSSVAMNVSETRNIRNRGTRTIEALERDVGEDNWA